MNQSQLIETVARETELNQAAAGQAVKAMVKAILDSLVAGEPVRVSGLGTFDVASRPARQGATRKAARPSKSRPVRQCGSTQVRPLKMPSIRRGGLLARRRRHQGNPHH
jgi:nucleoid DNA-binding protein